MFSTPGELLKIGKGGVISTNSRIIEEKLKSLRNHGIERDPKIC